MVDAGSLCGIVSIGDVIKSFVDDADLEARVLRDAYLAGARADVGSVRVTAVTRLLGVLDSSRPRPCEPTPPSEFDIFVQAVSPTGEVGEGAVGAGTFTAPGVGSVLIPAGHPV